MCPHKNSVKWVNKHHFVVSLKVIAFPFNADDDADDIILAHPVNAIGEIYLQMAWVKLIVALIFVA